VTAPVRWGVVGTGMIAGIFADTVPHTDGGELAAVGSRTPDAAQRFADAHGIPRAFGSYDELLASADVDAVYVATPHAQHADAVARALDAGKHVLCEKPMTVSADETRRVAGLARDRGVFLMEALWSRFLPAYDTVRSVVDAGEIGEVVAIDASLGFRAPLDPAHRLFAPELGGGSLLDLGIYPVHLAHFLLGAPTTVRAVGRVGTTGVDEHAVVTMAYDGAIAVAESAIRVDLAGTARITGTEGAIELPMPMQCPAHVDVTGPHGRDRRTIDGGNGSTPFRFEIEEVHRCLDDGLAESPTMPLAESVALATTLDRALAAIVAGPDGA
jgi:predicted dehydrogenase